MQVIATRRLIRNPPKKNLKFVSVAATDKRGVRTRETLAEEGGFVAANYTTETHLHLLRPIRARVWGEQEREREGERVPQAKVGWGEGVWGVGFVLCRMLTRVRAHAVVGLKSRLRSTSCWPCVCATMLQPPSGTQNLTNYVGRLERDLHTGLDSPSPALRDRERERAEIVGIFIGPTIDRGKLNDG